MNENIAGNVTARKVFLETLELAKCELTERSGSEARFWELMANEAAACAGFLLVPDCPKNRPMTDEEAKRFEQREVPFGVYAGTPVVDVDVEYWEFVKKSDFSVALDRYLRSSHYRGRVGLQT